MAASESLQALLSENAAELRALRSSHIFVGAHAFESASSTTTAAAGGASSSAAARAAAAAINNPAAVADLTEDGVAAIRIEQQHLKPLSYFSYTGLIHH